MKLTNHTIWIDDTEKFYNRLNKKTIKDMKKYGYVIYDNKDLNRDLTKEEKQYIERELQND